MTGALSGAVSGDGRAAALRPPLAAATPEPGPPVRIGIDDAPRAGADPGAGPEAGVPSPEAIGFKAHNLARMARMGLPVPPAFVLDTSWGPRVDALTPAVWLPALRALERRTGLRFGDARRPLLLSVRSGAPVSMPGMMETLLDIGLNDATVQGLVRLTGNPRLAWDAYRRLVAGYGEIVLGLPAAAFEEGLAQVAGATEERALDFAALRALAHHHLETVRRLHGRPFPQDAVTQLQSAIAAVFASWQGDKAVAYRRLKGLPEAPGTAVTVQRMVFGNAGGLSGAGVGFTRHPSTGEPAPWVDFLFNAQGEDVVSGRRTALGHDELATVAPAVWSRLVEATGALERAFGDMQDFEFTVEEGRLWLLQTRAGKRTPMAEARIALDLLDEGLIDRAQALRRTARLDEALLLQTRLVVDGADASAPLATAQSACSGVAVGEIALDAERAHACRAAGRPAILVRAEADTRDIGALDDAVGLLTVRGARTSHAAVVARQLGKVCLVGCPGLRIDLVARTIRLGDTTLPEGSVLTLDGNGGTIHAGAGQVVREAPADLMARLQALRDGFAADDAATATPTSPPSTGEPSVLAEERS
jgi:pyruvate,orthophosphate dikinase